MRMPWAAGCLYWHELLGCAFHPGYRSMQVAMAVCCVVLVLLVLAAATQGPLFPTSPAAWPPARPPCSATLWSTAAGRWCTDDMPPCSSWWASMMRRCGQSRGGQPVKGSEVQGISALLGEKQGWRCHAAGVLLHYTCAAIQVIVIQFSSLPPAAERAGHSGDDPLRGGDAGQVVRGGLEGCT